MSRKGFVLLPILIIVLLIITVGYFIYQNYQLKQNTLSLSQNNVLNSSEPNARKNIDSPYPEATVVRDINYKTYNTSNKKYSFKYPDNLTVKEEKQLRSDLFDNYTIISSGDDTKLTIVFHTTSSSEKYKTIDDFAKAQLYNGKNQYSTSSGIEVYTFESTPYGTPGPLVIFVNNQYIEFVSNDLEFSKQLISTFKLAQ